MSVIKEEDSEQSHHSEPVAEKNNFAAFMDNMNNKIDDENDEDKDLFKKLPSVVKTVEKEDPKYNFGAFMDALKTEEETKVEKEDPKINFGAFMDAMKTEEETKGEIEISSFDKPVEEKVLKKPVKFGHFMDELVNDTVDNGDQKNGNDKGDQEKDEDTFVKVKGENVLGFNS